MQLHIMMGSWCKAVRKKPVMADIVEPVVTKKQFPG